MLTTAAPHPSLVLKSRDLDQAYTQSETPVNRKVLCEVPGELGLDDSWVLVLVRPLYGLEEAGLYWFLTYFQYHKEDLGLSQTSLDQCFLYKRDHNELQALVSGQVDNSLALGDAAYMVLEEQKVTRFQHKTAKTLPKTSSIVFNGTAIHQDHYGLKLIQNEHMNKLKFDAEGKSSTRFASVRARGSYVANMSRPDFLANFQLLSGIAAQSKTEFSRLAATSTRATSRVDQGMSFVALGLYGPLKLVVFSDARFNTNADHTSQIRNIIALVDQNKKANVIAYTSKNRRVTRSP
jgi:hypothetical protein